MVNLDDTRHCPVAPECESCGRLDELAVVTGATPVGVLCMTVCDACELIAVHPILSSAEEAAAYANTGPTWGSTSTSWAGPATSHNPERAGGSGEGNPPRLTGQQLALALDDPERTTGPPSRVPKGRAQRACP